MTDLHSPPNHDQDHSTQQTTDQTSNEAMTPISDRSTEKVPEKKKNKTRSALMLILKIAITVGLLGYLLSGVDREKLLAILKNANPWLIVGGIAMMIVNNYFGAFRWQALLRSRGCHASSHLLTRLYLIGWFYGNFLPTQIGGDVARGIYLNRTHPGYVKDNILAMLVERLMGFLGLNALTLTGLVLAGNNIDSKMWTISLCLAAFCVTVVTMLFYAPYEKLIEKMLNKFFPEKASKFANILGAAKLYNDPRLLGKVLINSIMLQFTTVLPLYWVSVAIGAETALYYFLVVIPLSLLAGMMPFTISGYGIRENAMQSMLVDQAGISTEMATAIAFMFAFLLLVRALSGGVVLLLTPKHKGDEKLDEEAESIIESSEG